jgi:hypothetical protein
VDRYHQVRQEALLLAIRIHQDVPPGRERALAMTSLEAAVFWANAGIARGEMSAAGWIGVDLDGTLATYDGWKGPELEHIGQPVPMMLKRVKRWLAEGRDVRIFTARACIPEQVPPVLAWLRNHLGRELPVTCSNDLHMVELWDDRAVQIVPNVGLRADGAGEEGVGLNLSALELDFLVVEAIGLASAAARGMLREAGEIPDGDEGLTAALCRSAAALALGWQTSRSFPPSFVAGMNQIAREAARRVSASVDAQPGKAVA